MGTRDPAYARKGLGMPMLAETGSRDPSVHSWGTRDTGAHKQGTKDPDAGGIGTGELPQRTPVLWRQGHTLSQGQGTLAQAGRALSTLMSHGWGPGIPAHTGKGPQSPTLWEWRLGTLVHAGRSLNIPTAWRQGPGTPAHANKAPGTP